MPTTWSAPEPYASMILSITGGTLAGFIVVIVEWVGLYCHARLKRRKAIREIGTFFAAWEVGINMALGAGIKFPGRAETTKEQAQRAFHNDQISRFRISMSSRWGRHLSERQTEEILEFVIGHERLFQELLLGLGISPHSFFPDQGIYDQFFQQAREITWLEF